MLCLKSIFLQKKKIINFIKTDFKIKIHESIKNMVDKRKILSIICIQVRGYKY